MKQKLNLKILNFLYWKTWKTGWKRYSRHNTFPYSRYNLQLLVKWTWWMFLLCIFTKKEV